MFLFLRFYAGINLAVMIPEQQPDRHSGSKFGIMRNLKLNKLNTFPPLNLVEPLRPMEDRVLVLSPMGPDALHACEYLDQAGLNCLTCNDEYELCAAIKEGAAIVVLAEEALRPWIVNALLTTLGHQEAWSDLPLIVFTHGERSSDFMLELLGPISNTTILERPVRVPSLVSAVRAGIRARRRQYQVRDLLRRLAENDRRKDEFLAMLGHELRNPLAAIRNAICTLDELDDPSEAHEPHETDTTDSADRPAARQRQIIDRQTHHLVRMIDDLLDVSRVTLGKIDLHLEPLDLQKVVEGCLNGSGMRRLAQSHGLALTVETEPAAIQGDPMRLEQVVCNLVHNAVQYTPRGGSIEIEAGPEGGEAVIRIRDTGVGISRDMLGRIFEPFTQVEDSRTQSVGGLGLGLPLVRNLVKLHGGRVEALSSGPDEGSELVVRLPLQPAPPLPEILPEPVPGWSLPRDASSLRILVVEDNRDGRESLRDLLEIWGHEVEVAETGPEGVKAALASRPDVALIDIGLPGLDGNEVAQRIRADLESGGMPLIAMTGYGQPEDRRRALQAGFDAYLVKPVAPEELARTLRELVRAETEDPAVPLAEAAGAGGMPSNLAFRH